MNKLFLKKGLGVKRNYKILRMLYELLGPTFFNQKEYKDFIFDLGDRSIKIRGFKCYEKAKKTKLIIYIHGGGWIAGSLHSYTNLCAELSKRTKRIVLSIDYRLAPEYPFPNGFNDCYDVINMIMNNLTSIGLTSNDVCLMGDSAGGNLVAAVSLKSRKTKDFKIKEQVLLYPALQTDYSKYTKYKSVIKKGTGFPLTQKDLEEYISLYVKDPKDLNNPYVAPLKKKTLFFQPRTLIITANDDPLRDEGRMYYKKLKLFFNQVTYCNIKGALHGFLSNPLAFSRNKRKAYNIILKFLGDNDE